jgi:glucokinase-like ROK family protein
MAQTRKSADKYLVRQLNIALILNSLRTTQSHTRAMLAASTGLTRATVSSLVDELIQLNLVRETGQHLPQGGRPGTGLELNPEGGCAVGVEIGVDFISVVLADFTAQIRWRQRVEFTTRASNEVISQTEALVDQAIECAKTLNLRLLGIGLGLPGLVNVEQGLLKRAPNLGWRDIPFRALWETRFGVPVYVINEGNAAALGEHYFGVATSYHDFVLLSTSNVGLGAGIIIGGKLFQGIDGYAGEIGHMVLDPSGPPCACGRKGCWEVVAGTKAILGYAVEQMQLGRASRLVECTKGNFQKLTIEMVEHASNEGDAVASEAIERACSLFGVGIINLINIFNPQLIVIGGPLSGMLEPFLPVVYSAIESLAFRALSEHVEIKISELGQDACVMGAVAAVLDIVFTNPTQHFEVL